jgi:hypothetical protein
VDLQKRYKMTRGCPFGTVGNELTENDGLIRQDLGHLFEVVKHKLATFFVREKAQGRLLKDATKSTWLLSASPQYKGLYSWAKLKETAEPSRSLFVRLCCTSSAMQ